MLRSRIAGTGRYLPEQVRTNDDIAAMGLDTSDEWIRGRTGIGERRIIADGEQNSDMAAAAARHACDAAGIDLVDVDCLIVATATGDLPMPSCAVLTQSKLGATCPAFDVAAACAGFSHGLVVADAMVRTGQYRRVLFVGVESLSRHVDWTDRGTCILFGDGAGAVVLVPEAADSGRGVLATHLGSDGQRWEDLYIPQGGKLFMNGRVIFSHAVRHLSESCQAVMEQAGLGPDEVDLVLPHQANLRIIEAVGKRLRLSLDRFVVNIERYGNTSAASIPIALDEEVRAGRVTDGTTIVMCGLGAGLTWGAAAVRW